MVQALVITVPERQESFEIIRKLLAPFGIQCDMLPAVDARKPEVLESLVPKTSLLTQFLLRKPRNSHYEISTPGGIGCASSHLKAWSIIAQQHEPFLVVEDDFRLDSNMDPMEMKKIISGCMRLVRFNVFDYITLGHHYPAYTLQSKETFVTRIVSPFFGTSL
jgi:GR25 family glycosyltransferase involved in LPS biosynthesis